MKKCSPKDTFETEKAAHANHGRSRSMREYHANKPGPGMPPMPAEVPPDVDQAFKPHGMPHSKHSGGRMRRP